MKLYQRIEQILLQFRPVFRREATFEWFVLLFWGVVLSTQPPAVTSYLNGLGLGEGYYHQTRLRSTTFRQPGIAGIEPDDCFYIQNYRAMIGKDRIDLAIDPPPDLAIESDLTSKTAVPIRQSRSQNCGFTPLAYCCTMVPIGHRPVARPFQDYPWPRGFRL